MRLTLEEIQRAVVRVCTDRQASDADLAILGDRARWLLYRGMVRARLHGLVGNALPRSKALLGPAFSSAVDDWLHESAPRSPYFREVASEFAEHLWDALERSSRVPPHAVDLVVLERARWEASWVADGQGAAPIAAFDFDREPVVSRASRLVTLGFAVHEKDDPPRAGTFQVIVHRRPDASVATWTVNDTAASIFEAWTTGGGSAADGVRRVCDARGIGRDQAFFEGLAAIVAGLIERGILLGSRP